MRYRREIDGLRSIAVGSVLLNHADVPGFDGGFVGVDIFFVISGFLITTILYDEMSSTRGFSILQFYERRARRILPALFAMLFATSLVASVILLPTELQEFGKHLAGAALFYANITHMFAGGYFGGPSDLKPLLHTWSLAVEEQFYLFFPLFALVFYRWTGKTGLILFVLAASVASFALSIVFGARFVDYSFYLLPTRAWELGVGAFLALMAGRIRAEGWLSEGLSALGLAMMLWSIVALDETVPFPGIWTLVPVLGAGLFLAFGSERNVAGRLLSLPPMVGIGLISYSLYLWHQPVLAMSRIAADRALTLTESVGLLGVTGVLAWASWKWIEQPFRNRKRITRRGVFAVSGAGLAAFGVAGFALVASNGLLARYPAAQQAFLKPGAQGAYVNGRYKAEARDKGFTVEGAKRLMIIGDSFSQDFYNMIRENGAFPGYDVTARYIPAKCGLYMGAEDVSSLRAPQDAAYCADPANMLTEEDAELARSADVVVLVAAWQPWTAEHIDVTLASLALRPEQQLLVVGTKAFGRIAFRDYLKLTGPLSEVRSLPDPRPLAANDMLRATLPPGVFADMWPIICDPADTCAPFTPEGDLISYDGSHLTQAGAAWLGAQLFAKAPLDSFARQP